MRLLCAIATLLLLFEATNQQKVLTKRQKYELQKLRERLPVKNYKTLVDDENRKVNKYKDDVSDESEEVIGHGRLKKAKDGINKKYNLEQGNAKKMSVNGDKEEFKRFAKKYGKRASGGSSDEVESRKKNLKRPTGIKSKRDETDESSREDNDDSENRANGSQEATEDDDESLGCNSLDDESCDAH